jgi:hypothetical protein
LERWPERPWRGALLLLAAALTRETLLVVPAGLLVGHVSARTTRLHRPPTRALVTPFLALAAWVALVRLRIGAWPVSAASGRLAPPFTGLLDAARGWTSFGGEWTYLVLGGAILAGVVALRRDDRSMLGVVVVSAALGVFMGRLVWARWQDFTRPLLPLYAFGLVAILSPSGLVEPVRDGERR